MDEHKKQILELLDSYGAELFSLLSRITLRREIAQELMQDLFIKLNRMSNHNGIANLRSYARKMAMNLAFDFRRRQKKVVPVENIAEPASEEVSVLNRMIQDEQLQQILDAVGRLDETSRQAFVMRHLQQNSYDSIAQQLNKTAHQVRAICSRAMKQIRNMLGQNVAFADEKGGAKCQK